MSDNPSTECICDPDREHCQPNALTECINRKSVCYVIHSDAKHHADCDADIHAYNITQWGQPVPDGLTISER